MRRCSGFRVNGVLLAVPLLLLTNATARAEDGLSTVGEQRVLCKQPGRYIGWPSITLAPGGDLLVVFSGDRDSHVSADGKTQVVRSRDGGKTWSEALTIHDFPIDDRDAGIVRTRKGTLIVSWFTGPPYHTALQGNYVIRSSDGGRSWSAPIRTTTTTPHGPVQLRDGRLLFIGQSPHCSHAKPADYNGPPRGSPYSIAVEESRDDGRSWQFVTMFPVPEDGKMLSFDEPHVVEARDGKLVLLFRDCNKPNKLWQSESIDGGKSWSSPRRTPIQGYPPHLIRLHNDWLVVSYAKRWAPFGTYACISKDDGKTWDVKNKIRLSKGPNGDLGYPASVQLEDGSLWTVYYQIDKSGERPSLMGTHWRLEGAAGKKTDSRRNWSTEPASLVVPF